MECDTPLESSQGELQVFSRPHFNQRFEQGVMNSQSPGSPNRDNFGTSPWEFRDKKPFRCGCRGEYYMGEGGGFPRIWVVVSLVNPELPVACPSTKGVPKSELTNLLVGFMQVQVSK